MIYELHDSFMCLLGPHTAADHPLHGRGGPSGGQDRDHGAGLRPVLWLVHVPEEEIRCWLCADCGEEGEVRCWGTDRPNTGIIDIINLLRILLTY